MVLKDHINLPGFACNVSSPSNDIFLALSIEVTLVINLTQGAQPRWKFVYQIYPPAIDTHLPDPLRLPQS